MKQRDSKSHDTRHAGHRGEERKPQPRSTGPGVDQTTQRNEGTTRNRGRDTAESPNDRGSHGH